MLEAGFLQDYFFFFFLSQNLQEKKRKSARTPDHKQRYT